MASLHLVMNLPESKEEEPWTLMLVVSTLAQPSFTMETFHVVLAILLALNKVRGEIRHELSLKWQCGGAVGREIAFRQYLGALAGLSSPLIWKGSTGEGLIHSFVSLEHQ